MADSGHWRVRTETDPSAVIESAADLVAANPVAYSVFSTVAGSLVQEPTRFSGARWYVVDDAQGAAALVAMHTPPHALKLPADLPGAMPALARHIVAEGDVLPGVNGPKNAAQDFADAYVSATGRRITGREGIGVYDLPVPASLPWPVAGEHTVADDSHTQLVASWVEAFLTEVGDHPAEAEATARRQIAAGSVSLWVAGDRPVAMCWASAPYSGVVRVSGVYTPRCERGHGYASAVVVAASRRQQDRGYTCMLYTQLANPTSNKIYRAIGYRHLGDDLRLAFAAR